MSTTNRSSPVGFKVVTYLGWEQSSGRSHLRAPSEVTELIEGKDMSFLKPCQILAQSCYSQIFLKWNIN